MNSLFRCGIVVTTALGLAACASQGSMRYEPSVSRTSAAPADFQRDAVYVATVEQIARRRGIHVQWVNPPVKRVAAIDESDLE